MESTKKPTEQDVLNKVTVRLIAEHEKDRWIGWSDLQRRNGTYDAPCATTFWELFNKIDNEELDRVVCDVTKSPLCRNCSSRWSSTEPSSLPMHSIHSAKAPGTSFRIKADTISSPSKATSGGCGIGSKSACRGALFPSAHRTHEKANGRITSRRIIPKPVSATGIDFPFAAQIFKVRRSRTQGAKQPPKSPVYQQSRPMNIGCLH